MITARRVHEAGVRAFVAIELPDAVHEYLSGVQALFEPAAPNAVAWVRSEGMHLTLKFLGDVPESQVAAISDVLGVAARAGRPFHLQSAPLGMFPSAHRPRVIWAGVTGDLAALVELHRAIERGLAPLGFAADARPFRGHVTLGRVREGIQPVRLERLGGLVQEHRGQALSIPAASLTLFRSELERTGARYTRLGVFSLG